MIYKNYINKAGRQLTLTEYNRHAQQAYRKGVKVQQYLSSLGYTKIWGGGKGKWKSNGQSMDSTTN